MTSRPACLQISVKIGERMRRNASDETIEVVLRAIGQKVGKNVNPDGGEELKAFRAKAVVTDNDEQSTGSKISSEKMTNQDPERRASSQWLSWGTGAEQKGQALCHS